jgi:protocatechuate 3,4-dioxygenase alpha subunit
MTQNGQPFIASGSQTIGPFFHVGPGGTEALGRMAAPGTPGERAKLRLRLFDGHGDPVSDSLIELRQADAEGVYTQPTPDSRPSTGFSGFGRMPTRDDGSCEFETIKPGRVVDPGGSTHAPHIHVIVLARGLLRHLYTRVYFAGDPALASDAVLALVPEDRRHTLIAQPVAGEAGAWALDLHLQGDNEPVFFDL